MAPRRLVVHPDAIAEAESARQWYADRSEPAAAAFMLEIDDAIDSISEAPRRWPTYLHGTRRLVFRRFPFLLIYRESKDMVLVVALAHAKRKPGYWKGR